MATDENGETNVDGTLFTFPAHWSIAIFDKWPQIQSAAGELGVKCCDVLARDGETLWIVEMKDYTYPGAGLPDDLTRSVGRKAAGTMAMLYSLQRSEHASSASDFASSCADVTRIHLVLHVDVKDGGRKERQVKGLLMPLEGKLRKAQKALGLHKAYITSTLAPDPRTPWSARRDPATRRRHSDR